MNNLNLRGIPNEVYALLKIRAEQEDRSLNQQVLWLLRQSLATTPLDPQVWERIDSRRTKRPRTQRRSNSVRLLRKDRARLS